MIWGYPQFGKPLFKCGHVLVVCLRPLLLPPGCFSMLFPHEFHEVWLKIINFSVFQLLQMSTLSRVATSMPPVPQACHASGGLEMGLAGERPRRRSWRRSDQQVGTPKGGDGEESGVIWSGLQWGHLVRFFQPAVQKTSKDTWGFS